MDQPQWIQSLFEWIQANPNWTGVLIFLFAFGESLLLVGIIFPGAAFLVGLGALVGLGGLDFYTAWFWSSSGGFAGDGLSYWIGRRYKSNLLQMWPINKFPDLTAKGEKFFYKYGGIRVFIGRFVGPIRPVIPAVAGMLLMPPRKYILISIFASILWAPFYLLPGILFGSAVDQMAQIAGKLAILLVVLVALIWVVYWLVSFVYKLLVPRAYRFLSRSLAWSQRHPKLGKLTAGLVDPRASEKGSLAMLASFVVLLAILMIVVSTANDTMNRWNELTEQFFYAFHNPWTIGPLKLFLFIGHDLVALILTLSISIWLYYRRLTIVLYHWLFVSISAYFLALIICYFGHGQWHWVSEHHLAWFSAVAGWWAILVAGAYPVKWRSWPYVFASILIALSGFSILFFFGMNLSLVLVSIISGALWSMLVGIALRIRSRKQFVGYPFVFLLLFSLLSGIVLAWFTHSHPYAQNKPPESKIQLPIFELNPRNQVSEKRILNVVFKGQLEGLQKMLEASGWKSAEVKTWGSFYQALTAKQDAEELPIISSVYFGEIESLIVYLPISSEEIEVLHLWPDKKEPQQWIGSVVRHQRWQSLYLFNYWRSSHASELRESQVLKALNSSADYDIKLMQEQLIIE